VRKRFEYRRLRNEGRRVHTQSFVLQVAPSEHARARLGLTVSRHVGGAVRRNRIKRLVREAFRLRRDLFPATSDVVVIAKNDCKVAQLADVLRELERAHSAVLAAGRPRGERRGARP
jgi:ribonuclease P protein component